MQAVRNTTYSLSLERERYVVGTSASAGLALVRTFYGVKSISGILRTNPKLVQSNRLYRSTPYVGGKLVTGTKLKTWSS